VENGYRAGVEDAVIIPLVAAALMVKAILRAVLWVLMRILDLAFPLLMQLIRFPLFTLRVLGDGLIAAVRRLLAWLPMAQEKRRQWDEFIGQKWSRLRQKISYKVFEQAVHHAFEGGMEWVFARCRKLTPRAAMYVILAAVLWLPVSLGLATAIHALLILYAAWLPAWMQLLHPLATVIAKSKLLVLPVYPQPGRRRSNIRWYRQSEAAAGVLPASTSCRRWRADTGRRNTRCKSSRSGWHGLPRSSAFNHCTTMCRVSSRIWGHRREMA